MTDLENFRALPAEERERLGFKAYQWEQRISTHGPGCWAWGPVHYGCLQKHYEALGAEFTRYRETKGAPA